MYFSQRKGFTLIELLVVISIIAILSTIGLSAFTSAQQRARDARRRADMKAMQDSFEQYYSAGNTYAVACNTMATQLPGSTLPVDPKNVAQYVYSCTSGLTQYCACAQLETANGNSNTSCPAGGAQPTWVSGTGAFHCVRNLQ